MSVVSYGLQALNLDIDEDFLYSIPAIELNSGGQITAIVQGDIVNNVEIQTAAVLKECEEVIYPLNAVLTNLVSQASDITENVRSLENDVNALSANVSTLVSQITTLIEEIEIATDGYTTILTGFNTSDMNIELSKKNNANYWIRQQKIPLYKDELEIGIYVVNFNWVSQNNGDIGSLNTDTRFKISYAYCDNDTTNANIASSVNNCSGHNGVTISHSSSFCFDITTPTSVEIGIMFDIANTEFTNQDDLKYFFNTTQEFLYPAFVGINPQIIQVIKIA